MSIDFVTLAVCGTPLFGLLGLVAAVWYVKRAQHRAGMESYRAACRSLGLTQTDVLWEGALDGRWVGTSWTRLRVWKGKSRYYAYTRSVGRPAAPLGLGLYAFHETAQTLRGVQPEIEHWQRDLPARVPLDPDPYGGALRVHAEDVDEARRRLTRPNVVDAIGEALARCEDLRVTDEEVELLHEAYERSPDVLRARLLLAARIAHALE